MKRLVSVSASDIFIKYASGYYISRHYSFNVACNVISQEIGLFRDKYLLQLSGTEEDIQMFVAYLKHEGFKIHD